MKNQIYAPEFLDPLAQRVFRRLAKFTTNKELLSMLCSSYSTWQFCEEEIGRHIKETGSVLFDGEPHPAYSIQEKARAAFLATWKVLFKTTKSDEAIKQAAKLELDLDELEEAGDKLDAAMAACGV
jgi:phage terminase small subunit